MVRKRNRVSAKAAGRKWERDVADYFCADGVWPYADRRRLSGAKDRGDLVNTRPFVIECKAAQTINLASGCDEAKAELENDPHAVFWALVIKRRAKPIGQGYVVMDLDQFCRIAELVIEGSIAITKASKEAS